MDHKKMDLNTLNSIREYSNNVSPIIYNAVFQQMIPYNSSALPIRQQVAKSPIQYNEGIPVIRTKISPAPVRIPPSSISNQPISNKYFDINRVSTEPNSYTVEELKEIARSLGLPTTGRKPELVNRIKQRWFGQESILMM